MRKAKVKQGKKRLGSVLLSLCLICCFFSSVPVKAEAEYLTSEDWKYTVLADDTVEIAKYTGEAEVVTIPDIIEDRKVTSIGKGAFNGCIRLESIKIPESVTSIGEYAFCSCRSLTSITIPEKVTSIEEKAFAWCESLASITIPESVTSIGQGAFAWCESLANITIPKKVTSIGEGAFNGCSSLTSITIPGSVTSIEDAAFQLCTSLASITIREGVTSIGNFAFSECSSLESITIPESVTSIGVKAFGECSSLESITIPESVTSIGGSAFGGCSSLESITIPENVTSIGDYAFSGCSSLISITIPDRVTSIGECAFFRCTSLTSIDVASGSTAYASQEGILYNKAMTELIRCPDGKEGEITIPDSVESIGYRAFDGCSSLTSIMIPNSVTSIGGHAFGSCSSLESITIPERVTSIEACAFWGCSSLISITIPERVTNIEMGAFNSCSSLESITIPESVTSIGEGVFGECTSLTGINVASGSTAYASQEGILYNKAMTELICCPGGKEGEITIPEGIESIWNSAFDKCSSLTSVTIPEGVESIGDFAFRECSSLTSITIPESVKSIKGSVFDYRSDDLVIYGISGSHAEQYAEEAGITFVALDLVHTHTPVADPAVAPTCTTAGKTEGSHCAECGEVIKAQETISATDHTYKQTITQVTDKQDGSIIEKCSVCGDVKTNTPIYAASDITLSNASLTYNGKNQNPAVTVKDSKGNKLDSSTYSVSYPKSGKAVGEYTVTVTLKGNYSGTVQLKYQIVPKNTTISKLTAKKKGFTVKWKKQKEETTGYELQYSTSGSFKGAKTVTVSKNKTVSKDIAKLKAGKKYYVRIRTYKTVKVNGKNKKLYSDWSKAKTVKTKK